MSEAAVGDEFGTRLAYGYIENELRSTTLNIHREYCIDLDNNSPYEGLGTSEDVSRQDGVSVQCAEPSHSYNNELLL